jgi:hypothetical protein
MILKIELTVKCTFDTSYRELGEGFKVIKTCIKYVDKKSSVMRPNLQPNICKSPVVA